MRKVISYIAMSLDGYIADRNGKVDWLNGDGSGDSNMGSYNDFIKTVDTVILGYTTYKQIITELSPDNWVYAGKKSYVLTHQEYHSDNDDIFFTDENVKSLIKKLKKQDGKDIWICGGANVLNQFMEADLIDKYTFSVIPVILGDGVRLFQYATEQKLKLTSTRSYNGIVDLNYEKR